MGNSNHTENITKLTEEMKEDKLLLETNMKEQHQMEIDLVRDNIVTLKENHATELKSLDERCVKERLHLEEVQQQKEIDYESTIVRLKEEISETIISNEKEIESKLGQLENTLNSKHSDTICVLIDEKEAERTLLETNLKEQCQMELNLMQNDHASELKSLDERFMKKQLEEKEVQQKLILDHEAKVEKLEVQMTELKVNYEEEVVSRLGQLEMTLNSNHTENITKLTEDHCNKLDLVMKEKLAHQNKLLEMISIKDNLVESHDVIENMLKEEMRGRISDLAASESKNEIMINHLKDSMRISSDESDAKFSELQNSKSLLEEEICQLSNKLQKSKSNSERTLEEFNSLENKHRSLQLELDSTSNENIHPSLFVLESVHSLIKNELNEIESEFVSLESKRLTKERKVLIENAKVKQKKYIDIAETIAAQLDKNIEGKHLKSSCLEKENPPLQNTKKKTEVEMIKKRRS